MKDEQETNHAVARSLSNAGLGNPWLCVKCYPKLCSCNDPACSKEASETPNLAGGVRFSPGSPNMELTRFAEGESGGAQRNES